MKSVYSAVRTGTLTKAVCASSVKGYKDETFISVISLVEGQKLLYDVCILSGVLCVSRCCGFASVGFFHLEFFADVIVGNGEAGYVELALSHGVPRVLRHSRKMPPFIDSWVRSGCPEVCSVN